MATTPPPQSFEVGSCSPRWDNYRSVRLAWAEHAQRQGFVAKETPQKYNIVLSCATCSRSGSSSEARPPCAVEIEFDGVELAEKVVEASLKHNHRLSSLSPADVLLQEGKIKDRRADLFEYALHELNSIKKCGGLERVPMSEREVAQDRVVEDIRRAMGDDSAESLLEMARKRGCLVGAEAEEDSRSIATGFGLRPRPARASPPLPTLSSATRHNPTTNRTTLPDLLRTFRTLKHLDKSINAWAQSQGFSVRSSDPEEGEGGLRYCSARKTAAKCGWSLRLEVKSAKKVVVVEQCSSHTHPLDKGASLAKVAPKGKGKGKQRERSAAVEPEVAGAVKVYRRRGSTSPLDDQDEQQLWTPSLSPPRPLKRERTVSVTPRPRQPSPSPSSVSPFASTSNAKRRRRDSSSPLSDFSDDSGLRESSSQAQFPSATVKARFPSQPFSAADSLQLFLNKLIPEDGSLGDDYVHVFEAIGSRNPAFLMKMAEEDLEGVMELLSAETETKLPPLVLRALRNRLGGVKAA